ncbi:gag protein [Ditylenchus destructor]|uniref:Gag protein n=1 Tax=Ditylenchus destructor TaxID=166010 RepID=A0AAD4R524_9BILA|nr:gag protein [Ditylenchus destructor]
MPVSISLSYIPVSASNSDGPNQLQTSNQPVSNNNEVPSTSRQSSSGSLRDENVSDKNHLLSVQHNYPERRIYNNSGILTKKARTETSKRAPPYNRPCAFCRNMNRHWSSDCPYFVTVVDRQQQLVLNKHCLQCDRSGEHTCPQTKCFFCNETHWNALCDRNPIMKGHSHSLISDKTNATVTIQMDQKAETSSETNRASQPNIGSEHMPERSDPEEEFEEDYVELEDQ